MLNILVFLGLIFGKLLGYFTKEEVKEGKKYFILIEKILLGIIALGLLVVKLNIFSLSIILGVLLFFLIRRISIFLGLSVFLASLVNVEFGLGISSLVFLYLLVNGRESKWKVVIFDVLLFLIPFSLIFVESFINTNLGFLLGICAGGPVAQLGRTFFRKKVSPKKMGGNFFRKLIKK